MKRYKLMARDMGLIVGLLVLLTVLTLTVLVGVALVAYALI